MRRRLLSLFVLFALLRSFSWAQMSTLPVTDVNDELLGLRKNPPVFSAMMAIWEDYLPYRETVNVKGPVIRVEREEIEFSGSSSSVHHATLKFDNYHHLIEYIREESSETSTSTNACCHRKPEPMKRRAPNGQRSDDEDWKRWNYDDRGRLSDFRSGIGSAEWSHESNFKYDAGGRLLGYETIDESTFTKISYAGKTVTITGFDTNRRKSIEEVQVLDDRGRIVDLKVSLFPSQRQPWYHVRFKYDERGRLLEQKTDPFEWNADDDDVPLAGKLVVHYDDKKHSGEQKLYDPDGKMIFHARFEFDRKGTITKLQKLDEFGKEIPGEEDFPDPKTDTTESRLGNIEWEIIYGDHGNWTEQRRWFSPSDGSARIMTMLIRQKITYR